jgi:YD repeat-containing protein
MKRAFALVVALLVSTTVESLAQSTTIYNERGQIAGTAQTSGNVTTYRDAAGRMTGSAERLPDGRVQFRDAQGRLTGTATAPRQ